MSGPSPMTKDVLGPHSRACGISPHPHGSMCHSNCPTCGGKEGTLDTAAEGEAAIRPPHRVRLLGGPYDGQDVHVWQIPPRIAIGRRWIYERIDDPDTEEFLGAYVLAKGDPR